jgi:hypothetical protein
MPLTMRWPLALPLLLSLGLSHATVASDFSEMGEPGFARWALLSPERMLDVTCAHYAGYASRNGGPVRAGEAQYLRAAVTKRLTLELGSRKWALKLLEGNSWDDVHDPEYRYRELGPLCAAHIAALRDGTLEAKLAPVGGEPLQLPDIETCLAYDRRAQKLDPPIADNMFNENASGSLRDRALGATEELRTARENRVAALAETLPEIPRERLERVLSIGCIQALIASRDEMAPEVVDESQVDFDGYPADVATDDAEDDFGPWVDPSEPAAM